MLVSRYNGSRAFVDFLIWVMTLLLVFSSVAINGRTWPRFVTKWSYDTDKIYSTSTATHTPKKLSAAQWNNSFSSDGINSGSHSSIHFDDTSDYRGINGSCSEDSTVDSTCITGPFQLGRDVNYSVYNVVCPLSSSSRNKYEVPGMCDLFVICKEEKSFVIMSCNKDNENSLEEEGPRKHFNKTTGKCETSLESCQDEKSNFDNKDEILQRIISAFSKNDSKETKEENIVPEIILESSHVEANITSENLKPIPETQETNVSSSFQNRQLSQHQGRSVNDELEDMCKSGATSSHGLHAHPTLCQKYIQCGAEAGTFFIKTCGPGTVFNAKTLNCDWPINVDGCNEEIPSNHLRKKRETSKEAQCEKNGSTQETIIPDPENCNKYHVCVAGNVYTSSQTCNQGTLFNPLTSVCDFADNVDCADRKSDLGTYACDDTDNYIAPHPDHCNKFVECDHGTLAVKRCAPSTLYDREALTCEHAYKVTCRKPISLEHDIDVNFIHKRKRRNADKPSPSSSIAKLNLACEFNYIAPHPHNCYQFVECEDKRLYIKNCGPGTAYNPLLGQCDWPYNVRQADPNDCTRFRQCVQTHYQQRACPRNQFFDAEQSRCVNGSPYQIQQCGTRYTTTTRRSTTTIEAEYIPVYDGELPPPA